MIKFRAFDLSSKIMHYDFQFISSGDNEDDWILFKSDKQPLENGEVLANPYFRKQIKIMESWDRKDKDGQQLYDDDILEIAEHYEGDYTYKKEIVVLGQDSVYLDGEVQDWDLKVLGNIHENPELNPHNNKEKICV